MNIREAILKAADHIEMNPPLFNFWSITIPDGGCGTPACALGWIGFFSGRRVSGPIEAAETIGCISTDLDHAAVFYRQMDSIGIKGWAGSAALCAKALRLYADKYHPETKALVVYRPGADIVRDMMKAVA